MPELPAGLDLNLLRVLVQVYRDRKVSLAAEHLGMSQPAVSSALRRLRAAIGDKLFVPTARGMQPTPWTEQIAPRLAGALASIGDTMSCQIAFDAATSRRRFTLAMTDIGECHFLPLLQRLLRRQAPGVSVATVRSTAINLRVEMEQGKVDLALGHLPDLGNDFHQRLLFGQRYVCLFRKGHPLDVPEMPLARYAQAEHAVVLSRGSGHGRVDELIERAGVQRRIRLRLPHFVALADVLEDSDLVATVPEVFARRSVRHFDLSYRPHPVALPAIEVRLFWHTAYHRDPASAWLRELIVHAFGEPACGTGRQDASPAGARAPCANALLP